MNQRIRELAEQAKPLDKNGQTVRGLNSEYHDSWMKKFAELIVRESIEVCMSRVGNSDYTTGRMDRASDLREHFGIEE